MEKHRNYITTHRNDDSYSALYAAHQDVFVKIGEGKSKDTLTETTYKMDKVESNLLKNFLFGRNSMMLMAKTNVDVNGKASITDPDTGRPINTIYVGLVRYN